MVVIVFKYVKTSSDRTQHITEKFETNMVVIVFKVVKTSSDRTQYLQKKSVVIVSGSDRSNTSNMSTSDRTYGEK